MIEKYMGLNEDPYIDIRTVVKCPYCSQINRKKGTDNMLTCESCERVFCYICNKPIDGPDHYKGKATCNRFSEFW